MLPWDFSMSYLRSETAPLSDAVTNDIRVEVLRGIARELATGPGGMGVSVYGPHYEPGNETVQLLSRHWIITDALDDTREIKVRA